MNIFLKNTIASLLITITVSVFAQSKMVIYSNDDDIFTIKEQSKNKATIAFNVSKITATRYSYNNQEFTKITINGFGKSFDKEMPDLPVFVKRLTVPESIHLQVSIKSYEKQIISLSNSGFNNVIIPAQSSIAKNVNIKDTRLTQDIAYSKNRYIKSKTIELIDLGVSGNNRVYKLIYRPLNYNPVKNILMLKYNVITVITTKDNNKINSINFSNNNFLAVKRPNTLKSEVLHPSLTIVSPAKYKLTLQPFVKWKKQCGFHVNECYLGEDIGTNDKDSIKNYLENTYNNPPTGISPPSYLILVGDVADIPAWSGKTGSHATDLYYAEYSGDYLPELYYGRISVENEEQLTSVLNKTLLVEKGQYSDTSENTHLLISGVDDNYAPAYGNGTINYLLKYYSNKNLGINSKYYLYGSGSPITSDDPISKQAILNDFSSGTSIAYYTAHCLANGWQNPEFEIDDIATLSNNNKYPLMIGNCCQSAKYNLTSFGEEIVRADKKGAVAYIGASADTYWDEDYYWGVGFVSEITSNPDYENSDLGTFDSWFHTHNEPNINRAYSAGQIVYAGNMAVENSASSLSGYYWEVYNIIGDPSLIPPKYKYNTTTASYNSILKTGQTSLYLQTIANAVVTITVDNSIYYTSADDNGNATIYFDPLNEVGSNIIELVITNPEYKPLIDSLSVIPAEGSYPVFESYTTIDTSGNNNSQADYGELIEVFVKIKNYGNDTTKNISLTAKCNSNFIDSIWQTTININNIPPEQTTISDSGTFIKIKNNIPDNENITINYTMSFDNDKQSSFSFQVPLLAPSIVSDSITIDKYGTGNLNGIIDENETATITVSFINDGSSQVSNTTAVFSSSDTSLFIVKTDTLLLGGINAGENIVANINIHASDTIFPGSVGNIKYSITAGDSNQYLFSGNIPVVLGGTPTIAMHNDSIEIVTGLFYDSGGKDNNYSSYEDFTTTFVPHNNGEALSFNFSLFDVESSSSGCYDKLYVYNGLTTNSELIGVYCNKNHLQTAISQNPYGAITFRFTSDNGVVRPGWKAYISSSPARKVTIKTVDDYGSALDSCVTTLVNKTDTTDNDGFVYFNYIPSNPSKELLITKENFFDYKTVINTLNSDTTIEVHLKKLPDVLFNIQNENNQPLDAVIVTIDNDTVITGYNGMALFESISKGTKKFTVSHEQFTDTSGYILVDSCDVNISISLRLQTYSVQITVTDDTKLLSGATVTIDTVTQQTDTSGTTVFYNILPAQHSLTVKKDGYLTHSDIITIDNNTDDTVLMIKTTNSISLEDSDNNLIIYPNPTKNSKYINVENTNNTTISKVEIYNIWGHLIFSRKVSNNKIHKLYIKNLDDGVYFIKTTIGEKEIFNKLIKQ